MKNRRRLLPILLLIVVLLTALGVGGYVWLFSGLPDPGLLAGRLNVPSVRITDRYGRLLYEAISSEGGRHTVLPFEQIPLRLRQATLATEDRYFYTNAGVDFIGILRAFWINLQGGETLAGGSTITQQVARNLLLDAGERGERSLRRKLREGYLAWQLSRRYTKDEILGFYLNQSYYGGMAYGVEAAAQTFFGKSARELDLAESALLAGLPQAPAIYNPFTNPTAAQERQEVVLGLMEAQGLITPEQRALAGRQPLQYASAPYPMEAPHFVMMVRAAVDQLFSPQDIYDHGGLTVRTTLDLDWQHHAERAVLQQIEALRQQEAQGLSHNLNSAALVALNPQTGEILALVGSPDYFDSTNGGAINMVLAPRQPGSSIKPIVYATAFDPTHSSPWNAATLILDVTTVFHTREGEPYIPKNYDGLEHGPVLARQALASSLNIPAVKTLEHVGMSAFFAQAGKMGITTLKDPAQYDLSLALGGGEVRLLELAAAYGAFANGGYRLTPQSILEVSDPAGQVLYTPSPAAQPRVVDERVAWLVSDILSDNDARILGFGPNSVLRLDRPAAVKTGTTSNFHDNWTVGYTPDLVVGVWAGNTNYEPMRNITGLTGAAPIWHQFMRTVLANRPERSFARPAGLVQIEVCALSGLLPSAACPYHRLEWFISGTQPLTADTFYHQVVLDSLTNRLASGETPSERRVTRIVLDLPPEAQNWAHAQGLLLLSDLQEGQNAATLALTAPIPNAIYRLSASLGAEAQRILLSTAGESGWQQITFFVDGVPLASQSGPPYEAWWQLSAGEHIAWAEGVRADGEHVTSPQVHFKVLP